MCQFIFRAIANNPHAPQFEFKKAGIDLHCDCRTPLGSKGFDAFEQDFISKKQKEGWGAAKIERALADVLKNKTTKVHPQRKLSWDDEVAYWVKTITTEVSRKGWMGLLLHLGDTVTQQDLPREHLSLADLTAEQLVRMKQDVIYLFLP